MRREIGLLVLVALIAVVSCDDLEHSSLDEVGPLIEVMSEETGSLISTQASSGFGFRPTENAAHLNVSGAIHEVDAPTLTGLGVVNGGSLHVCTEISAFSASVHSGGTVHLSSTGLCQSSFDIDGYYGEPPSSMFILRRPAISAEFSVSGERNEILEVRVELGPAQLLEPRSFGDEGLDLSHLPERSAVSVVGQIRAGCYEPGYSQGGDVVYLTSVDGGGDDVAEPTSGHCDALAQEFSGLFQN